VIVTIRVNHARLAVVLSGDVEDGE